MYLRTSGGQVINIGARRRLYQLITRLLLHGRIELTRIIVISIISHPHGDSVRRYGRNIRMRVISLIGIITITLP